VCGICGVVSRDREVVSRPRLERMNGELHHRGPDDAGVWIGGAGDVVAGLAHRRLSIIDLSAAGHQPMTGEDGSLWLTYNGEIYNHEELRRDLERSGHRYRSHTDSETIIHAFEEWGDAAVERFRGMFAFALWDDRRKRLTLVRDRLGIKPLYYAVVGDTLIFGSEIKAILASDLLEPAVAEGAVPEYLAFGYLAGEETMFRGIRKLPPGHILIWDRGRVETRRYWSLQFKPDSRRSDAELAEELNRLFHESVRLRLMSDVPLGVFLSGGLDSTAIAAVMSRLVDRPIQTFSVGFESRYYSETSYAREAARHVGADHHEVTLTADKFYEAFPRLVWHEDEPLWGTASVALYVVSELAVRNVKVVLTGEGSDELFAGYDRYWMTQLNARLLAPYKMLPRAARHAIRRALFSDAMPVAARRALGHTFLYHDTVPEGLMLDSWFGIFPPEWQRRIAGPELRRQLETADVYASRRDIFNASSTSDLVDRFLELDIKTSLVELLMKQDQMSMATSIESRVPFLDHKLVEFAATIPSRLKISGFAGKKIVKDALGALLPPSIVQRKKMGFPVPWEQWLNESYLPEIESTLLSERSLDRRWLSREGVRTLLDEHRAGRRSMARQIWTLWGLEVWARGFLDRSYRAEQVEGPAPAPVGALR
jgi:asparagine synthase (glutamine-hydrolysing)